MRNRSKIISLLLFTLLFSSFDNVIDYKINLDRKDVRLGETVTVIADITLEKGYYIYSVDEFLSLSPSYFEWPDSTQIKYFGKIIRLRKNYF